MIVPVVCFVLLALGTTGSPAPPAPVVDVASMDVLAASERSFAPTPPRIVAGYSFHARQRMEERGIPEWHVRAVIEGPDPGIFQDDNDTWIVTDGVLVVVIDARGFIVTGFPGG